MIYRDGKIVPVLTDKEVDDWLLQTSDVLDAIKTLGTLAVSPKDYLRGFPPESAYEIDDHLAAATHWLSQFTQCWKARH